MSNDIDKLISDIKKQTIKAATEEVKKRGIDIECPHCGRPITVKSNTKKCPLCKKPIDVKINL